MTDDPRDILKAAGAECAEVQAFMDAYGRHEWTNLTEADAAIIALARLAAKFKWMAEHEGHHIVGEWFIDSRDEEELDFLEREAGNA